MSTTSLVTPGSDDVPETFVEQHTAAIAHLQALVVAVQNYVPGMPGLNAALQEALRPLRLPEGVNMTNVMQWATTAIDAEEKALALELRKEAALADMKAAERTRRDAERQAKKARKAWAALANTPNPLMQANYGVTATRKGRAVSVSNTEKALVAA